MYTHIVFLFKFFVETILLPTSFLKTFRRHFILDFMEMVYFANGISGRHPTTKKLFYFFTIYKLREPQTS